MVGQNVDSRVGGYVPASCVRVTEPFLRLRWDMHSKTSADTIRNAFTLPLNESEQVFVDFPNTAMYSPVCYLPHAVGIFLMKKFGQGPLSLFYAARFCGLLFWILGMSLVIRLLPFYKWMFVLLALLPMSVFIHMSVSADTVTNVMSFLVLAYLLKLIYHTENISPKHYALLCVLAVLLALSKQVYTPLILPALLIPSRKFGGRRRWFLQLGALFLLAFGACVLWSGYMNGLYLPYKNYNPQFRDYTALVACADMYSQKQNILSDGIHFIKVMTGSLYHSFDMYFQGYIGVFGWLDSKLPAWFVWLAYGIIAFCIFIGGEAKAGIAKRSRLLIFLAGSLIVILVLLTQHLTWDCVGSDLIATIQGRYFIPLGPLLAIFFYNRRFSSPALLSGTVMAFSLAALPLMTKTLYGRYYVAPHFDTEEIRCNAETITPDHLFATDKPGIVMGNTDALSNGQARSGSYSLKLSADKPFGFTYKAFGLDDGDVIRYGVWRRGHSGGLVVSGGGDDMFMMQSQAFETDSAGWEHLELLITLQKKTGGKEIGFYIFNNSNDTSYFDDVEISLKRLR